MIEWFKSCLDAMAEPVRRGNEHRAAQREAAGYLQFQPPWGAAKLRDNLEKNGYKVAKQTEWAKGTPFFQSNAELKAEEDFLSRFGIIRHWTTARFVDESNPNFNPVTGDPKAIAKFNINSGKWEALVEH